MRFEYTCMSLWPPLAWLARCSTLDRTISVYHGPLVETREHWFCEAVWEGDFADGDFDKTDIIAGSGARIREDRLCFVSSGSNVDRLHFVCKGDAKLVSNSLVCLLAWLDDSPDPAYHGYSIDFSKYGYTLFGKRTIVFPGIGHQIGQTYFSNLAWESGQLIQTDKPHGDRHFDCFETYRDFVQGAMQRMARNAADHRRARRYRLLCPLSNGYDSPTVAALAQGIDGVEAFTFDVDREGRHDSGKAIADVLGIPCHAIDRDAWRAESLAEVPFIAASGSIGDLAFKPAEDLLAGSVFISGYAGDTAWNKHTSVDNAPVVGHGSMLGLTEYRLWIGFLNCPVPIWGVRQVTDLVRISNSEDMRPWDLGGTYSRPICRRIVEAAGVPREEFGMGKRGVSVVPPARRDYLTPDSMKDLLAWLEEQRLGGSKYSEKFPKPSLACTLDDILTPIAKASGRLHLIVRRRGIRGLAKPLRSLCELLARPYYHHRYLVHWAIDRAKLRYQGTVEQRE